MVTIIEVTSCYQSREEAQKNLQHLLERKLIGCGYIKEIDSAYWWENKIQQEHEWLLKVKTTTERAPFVIEELQRHHSYEIAYIAQQELLVVSAYRDWLINIVNK